MQRSISTLALAGTLAIASSALANSGTLLPLDQYQAGTEVTNTTIVQNGGFENVDGLGEPTSWTKVGNIKVGAPTGANVSAANGSKAARFEANGSVGDTDINKYTQVVTLAPSTNYYISAYLWTHSQAYDLSLAEMVTTSGPLTSQTVSLASSDPFNVNPVPIDGTRGVFAYRAFNSNIFSAGGQVEVEFDADGTHDIFGLAGQMDNICITPASQFQAPGLVPEPASLSLLAIGAAGLLRRRRI